jgi:hypothetical protein
MRELYSRCSVKARSKSIADKICFKSFCEPRRVALLTALAFPLSLICELSPSLRHFVENTLMMLISSLIAHAHSDTNSRY